jgi:predicted chitinase
MNYATINGLWFFSSRVGTKLDLNSASVKQVTKIVNGGYNGLKTREKFYDAAIKALY